MLEVLLIGVMVWLGLAISKQIQKLFDRNNE